MDKEVTTTLDQLRGSLKPSKINARGLTKVAQNSDCKRLGLIIIAGTTPATVATDVFRITVNEGQSPFAIIQGLNFERTLLRSGGARLLKGLHESEILGSKDNRVCNLEDEIGGNIKNTETLIRYINRTDDLIRQKARGDPNAPNVIYQAVLPIMLGRLRIIVRPDLLVAKYGELMYRIGEIKSYGFEHHLTDEHEVGGAAAQAGVYGAALMRRLTNLGLAHTIPEEAVLVFKHRRGNFASAHLQLIERDIVIAERVLLELPFRMKNAIPLLGEGETLDKPENVLKVPYNYTGRCRSFCELVQVCQSQARHQADPSFLGNEVEEFLAPIGSLDIAIDLLKGATPCTPEEAEVQAQLNVMMAELREAS